MIKKDGNSNGWKKRIEKNVQAAKCKGKRGDAEMREGGGMEWWGKLVERKRGKRDKSSCR